MVSTHKHLDISLGNSTTYWFYDISTSVFKTIGSLQSLTDLTVRFHPGLHVTDAEFSALANLENLRCLDVSEMPVNTGSEQFGPPWRSALQITQDPLLKVLLALRKLEWFHIDLQSDPILIRYHDAVEIEHLLSNLRRGCIRDLMLISEDVKSDVWPNEADWLIALPLGVWLPTNRAFNPDPHTWSQRILDHETTGKVAETDQDSVLDDFGLEINEFFDFEDGEDSDEQKQTLFLN